MSESEQKKDDKIPKGIELINQLASFLSSDMEYGQSIAMTPLSEKIIVAGIKPHVHTIRNKLLEGFVLRDILKDFKPTYDKGEIVRIEKIDPTEVSMERIMNILMKMNDKLNDINKKIANVEKEIESLKKIEGIDG